MSNDEQWRAKAALERERAEIDNDRKRADLSLYKDKQNAKRERDRQKHQDRIDRGERNRRARVKKLADRAKRASQRRAHMRALQTRVRDNVAGTMSGCVYIIALSSAALGQMQTANGLGLPVAVGAMFVVFLEGGAISAALTAHKARIGGERSLMAQTVMLALTTAAVAIQIFGHASRLEGAIMATATITAVVVFEMRLSIAVTEAERKRGITPPARFGARRWIVAPLSTVRAWRMDVISRVYGEASAALSAAADSRREARTVRTGARTQRRTARERRRTVRAYNRAVRTAVRTGTELPPHPGQSADTTDNHADTRGQNDHDADTTDETADSVPMIGGQPALMTPDTVPDEWVAQYGSPARTLSADSPDNDQSSDSYPDTKLSADTDGADSADTPGRISATTPPVADSPADTPGHDADSSRTPADTRGQSADSADSHTNDMSAYTYTFSACGGCARCTDHITNPTHIPNYIQDAYCRTVAHDRKGRAPSARKFAAIVGIGKTKAADYLQTLNNPQIAKEIK